jgi:hypothetical protein
MGETLKIKISFDIKTVTFACVSLHDVIHICVSYTFGFPLRLWLYVGCKDGIFMRSDETLVFKNAPK